MAIILTSIKNHVADHIAYKYQLPFCFPSAAVTSRLSASDPPPAMSLATTNFSAPCIFFGIPPELRILIYEHVFSEIEDSVSVRVLGRANKHRNIKRNPSKLALLLTCRQINSEAWKIAYSKMSMLFDMIRFATRPDDRKEAECVHHDFDELVAVFGYEKLHRIPYLEIEDSYVLSRLAIWDCCAAMRHRRRTEESQMEIPDPTIVTRQLRPAEELFCNIARMTVRDLDLKMEQCEVFEDGPSWFWTVVQPGRRRQERFLRIFQNLKEITVKRITNGTIAREIFVERIHMFGGQQDSLIVRKEGHAVKADGVA